MIVATVVVAQVLSNDVREHLPEYATLKAMGYSTGRLARVVVEQSLIYMIIAYLMANWDSRSIGLPRSWREFRCG